MADSGLIPICEAAALIECGDGVRFSLSLKGIEHEAFVVRHQGRALGYLNRCAHTGLELDWMPGRFLDSERRWLICAAHGALYEPATGGCAAGPCAGRGGLVPVPVVEIDGVVYWLSEAGAPSA
ncbi:MAG TPA: Rieske 2Fe-2S domain-containing protein [Burkholderiaceae bacterium]|nr:Rieske 2Fe-2S domain-containing protein [Burkholderiaceae bacterium]